jgi:predicted metal-binding membrane protein
LAIPGILLKDCFITIIYETSQLHLWKSFGTIYGSFQWFEAITTGIPAASGTVMLAALPVLIGVQSLFAFINHDVMSVPKTPLHLRLHDWSVRLRPVKKSQDTAKN